VSPLQIGKSALDPREIGHIVHRIAEAGEQVEPGGALGAGSASLTVTCRRTGIDRRAQVASAAMAPAKSSASTAARPCGPAHRAHRSAPFPQVRGCRKAILAAITAARSGSSTPDNGSSSPVGQSRPRCRQFLLEDIGRALVAREQVGAVLGADEGLQRMDAGEQADEIILPAEREHRVDQVVADAGFALLDLEAVGEESRRSPSANQRECRSGCFGLIISTAGSRSIKRTPSRTAQRKGILGASRLLINREEARSVSSLSASAHRHRHRRGRHVVALPDRLVVIADRVGHGIGRPSARA
jgi:hypothetical protein